MPSMPLMSPAAPCGGTIARSAPFDAISALGWAAASAWSPSFQDDPDGRAKALELERAADTSPASRAPAAAVVGVGRQDPAVPLPAAC